MPNCCAWKDCNEEGEFRAPSDNRNLRQYRYFCAAHIKAFNKQWNGLKGFTENEIFDMQNGGATWNRPTWKMGTQAPVGGMGTQVFESAEDLFKFFKQRKVSSGKVEENVQNPYREIPADVREACSIFNVENPIHGKILKQKYLKLVKENHPDTNPDKDNAEDSIKRINVAYRILEDFDGAAIK